MKRILLLIVITAALCQSKITEEQKENFFSVLQSIPEGRNFLSMVASHIIEETEPYMKFSFGTGRKVENPFGGVTDWLSCQTCRATVLGLDTTIRT